MENLNNYRLKINQIDNKLIKLLEERMLLSVEIGKVKALNNLPILNIDRENEIIDSLQESTKLPNSFVSQLWNLIFHQSRDIQLESNLEKNEF